MAISAADGVSYWEQTQTQAAPGYPALGRDLDVDVVIVGAGIVGLSTALDLLESGKSVVVLEGLRIGTQVTARSTAKVTSQHGLIYAKLLRELGDERARLYAQANQRAIDQIEATVARADIDCGFQRLPAFAYTVNKDSRVKLQEEADAAARLGLPASVQDGVSAPPSICAALRFDDQAQFNPVRYLHGLAAWLSGTMQIFERTRVVAIKKGDKTASGQGGTRRLQVKTEAGNIIGADDVVVATHMPISADGMFFIKAFPFSHSMVAAPLDSGKAVDGMFVSIDTPAYSFRVDTSMDTPYLIAVGPTFKTGVKEDEQKSFDELDRFLNGTFGIERATHRWSNMDFKAMDGVPFMGRVSSSDDHLYVATGFNAWGITSGTVAGRLIADQIEGRDNDYATLFDASRIRPLAGGKEFLKENTDSAKHFVADRFHGQHHAPETLSAGQASVFKHKGEHIAACRDAEGHLHAVSAVCTHMGCIVGWNPVDQTWDCPCHGSRFFPDGRVMHGPAVKALTPHEPGT